MVVLRKLLRNQVKKWNQTGQVPAWCSVKSWDCFQGLWEEVFCLTMLQNYPTCTAGFAWCKNLVALSLRIFQWPLPRLWRKVFASARNLVRTVFWCISFRGIMIAMRLPWGLCVTVRKTGWIEPQILGEPKQHQLTLVPECRQWTAEGITLLMWQTSWIACRCEADISFFPQMLQSKQWKM